MISVYSSYEASMDDAEPLTFLREVFFYLTDVPYHAMSLSFYYN